MSFKLISQVSIGKYVFSGGINEVKILRSVKNTVDTCSIKIPAAGSSTSYKQVTDFALELLGTRNSNPQADQMPPSSVATSTLWQEGDKVTILLGYGCYHGDGYVSDYRVEFKGFVRLVSPSVPVLIECEGYAWQLRRKQFIGSWKSIKLRDFLQIMVAGTDIILSPNIPDVPLTNLTIKDGNALSALEYLKNKVHLAAYFQFDVLYVGLEELPPTLVLNKVNYRLGWNTIKDDRLKYRLADNTNVLIKVFGRKGKNKKLPFVTAGDKGGSIVNITIAGVIDVAHMQRIANQALLYRKYTGFEGSITAFLQPYCNPSDTVAITDKQYAVRSGNYFVEGIEVTFGMDGARRIINIGPALSVPQYVALINKNDNSAPVIV